MEQQCETEGQQLIVAAIDFGTTYTGYAWSKKDFKGQGQIYTSKWGVDGNVKVPTCVLLNPSGEFEAFGSEAEEKYKHLCDDNNALEHYFFGRFKMMLYHTKEKLTRNTTLKDVTGKKLPALMVFAIVIKHLTDLVLDEVRRACAGLRDDDVQWVITVPAIWSDSAKQFMREAASKAGIANSMLKLALEPEAASLYCNTEMFCKKISPDGTTGLKPLPVGHRYIVADLGGGTLDMSVHEILEDRNLKEIQRADGEAHGAILVDKEFERFLADLFGEEAMAHLSEHNIDKYMDTSLNFEKVKLSYSGLSPSDKRFRIQIPVEELKDAIKATSDETFEHIKTQIDKHYKGKVQIKGSKLHLSQDIMHSFFSEVTDTIIKSINEFRIKNGLDNGIEIWVVGGFCSSKYVQDRMKEDIPELRIPLDPSVAVLKGAVIFGRSEISITQRIARFTYGFTSIRPFDSTKDPESLKIRRDGTFYCNSVFIKIITKGESLMVQQRLGTRFIHVPNKESDTEKFAPLITEVRRSSDENPLYSTDKYGCELLGALVISPPNGEWPAKTELFQGLTIGDTELESCVYNVNTDQKYNCKLDFL